MFYKFLVFGCCCFFFVFFFFVFFFLVFWGGGGLCFFFVFFFFSKTCSVDFVVVDSFGIRARAQMKNDMS